MGLSCRAGPQGRGLKTALTIKGSLVESVGRVSAPDEKTAIERAIVEYGITNREHQKRLVAQRVG